MSNTQAIPPEATGSPSQTDSDLPARLGELRAEIDRLDDALHDLLMRRAAVVEQVAGLGRIGKIPFRPGREAAIIRRLLARHTGRLPRRAIVRFWREMFAANISIEARFLIATCAGGAGDDVVALAREHFGPLTPLRVSGSPAEVMAAVAAGQATAAVLPMPAEGATGAQAWWTALMRPRTPRLYVVSLLPFLRAPRPEGAAAGQALVVAAAAPDPSGADRSFIGFELPTDESQAGPSTAGFAAASLLLCRDAGYALIDVEGFVADDDPRLRALAGAVVLGGYAFPVVVDPS